MPVSLERLRKKGGEEFKAWRSLAQTLYSLAGELGYVDKVGAKMGTELLALTTYPVRRALGESAEEIDKNSQERIKSMKAGLK